MNNTGNSFIATFASLCDYCSNHIAAGDTVSRLFDDRYICTTCVQAGVDI